MENFVGVIVFRSQETERDAEQNTVEMLEKQMNQLFKMRVDVNDLDPQDIVVKCNKVSSKSYGTEYWISLLDGKNSAVYRSKKDLSHSLCIP